MVKITPIIIIIIIIMISTSHEAVWNVWFLARKESPRTPRKTLRARTRTNNKLNPHVTPGLGFEPEPQMWFDHRF